MKKFLKRCFEFLQKHDIIEPLFDSEYPTLSKAWVEAFKKLADNKVNQRFLCDRETGRPLLTSPNAPVFFKYKIYPLKGASVLFRWLRQVPARDT